MKITGDFWRGWALRSQRLPLLVSRSEASDYFRGIADKPRTEGHYARNTVQGNKGMYAAAKTTIFP